MPWGAHHPFPPPCLCCSSALCSSHRALLSFPWLTCLLPLHSGTRTLFPFQCLLVHLAGPHPRDCLPACLLSSVSRVCAGIPSLPEHTQVAQSATHHTRAHTHTDSSCPWPARLSCPSPPAGLPLLLNSRLAGRRPGNLWCCDEWGEPGVGGPRWGGDREAELPASWKTGPSSSLAGCVPCRAGGHQKGDPGWRLHTGWGVLSSCLLVLL